MGYYLEVCNGVYSIEVCIHGCRNVSGAIMNCQSIRRVPHCYRRFVSPNLFAESLYLLRSTVLPVHQFYPTFYSIAKRARERVRV